MPRMRAACVHRCVHGHLASLDNGGQRQRRVGATVFERLPLRLNMAFPAPTRQLARQSGHLQPLARPAATARVRLSPPATADSGRESFARKHHAGLDSQCLRSRERGGDEGGDDASSGCDAAAREQRLDGNREQFCPDEQSDSEAGG